MRVSIKKSVLLTLAVALSLTLVSVANPSDSSSAGASPAVAQASTAGVPALGQQVDFTTWFLGVFYGRCEYVNQPATPFVMPNPPTGRYWSLLFMTSRPFGILADWVFDPVPGASYTHNTGRPIMRAIVCSRASATPPTTTTTSTTSTTSTTTSTTTTSTTSTTSTTTPTTTSSDPCENYTPRLVTVTPSTVIPGGTVTVSGTGTPGTTLLVSLKAPPGSSTTGPQVTITVPASGNWSVQLTVPTSASPGTWTATAQASDCAAVSSSDFTVALSGPGGPTTPPPTAPPGPSVGGGGGGAPVQVAPATIVRELPSGAVDNVAYNNRTNKAGSKAGTQVKSKLAWTGSTVRIPLTIAATLLMVGALLVLRSRRHAI